MTETNTTPTFPPGRYGRRRDPRRHRADRVLAAAAGLGVVLIGAVAAVVLGQQYGPGRPYEPSVTRFYDVTDAQVVVEFTVKVPEGEVAVCAVRARAAHGGEVGREEVRVEPAGETARTHVVHTLPTSERPVTGEVQRCWPAR